MADCQERVGHEWEPFAGVAVGSDHGGGFPVTFGYYLVKVGGLGGGKGLECEIVDNEQVDGGQAAVFVVEGVVEADCGEALEEFVGAGHAWVPQINDHLVGGLGVLTCGNGRRASDGACH